LEALRGCRAPQRVKGPVDDDDDKSLSENLHAIMCVKTVTVYIHFMMLPDRSRWNEQQYNYSGHNIMALQQLIHRNNYLTY
jgi:hypothetical protein